METNQLPKMNMDTAETNCCPKFNPVGWDGAEINLDNQSFVRAKTCSLFHIPLNMGSVYKRVCANAEKAGAFSKEHYLVLSHDPSAFKGEHLFRVEKEVPGEEMTTLNGKFITKVFEGHYRDIPKWMKEMEEYVKTRGKEIKKQYAFYTTCPKCLKHYGKNYVVLFAQID